MLDLIAATACRKSFSSIAVFPCSLFGSPYFILLRDPLHQFSFCTYAWRCQVVYSFLRLFGEGSYSVRVRVRDLVSASDVCV